jgi:hypothetical protein
MKSDLDLDPNRFVGLKSGYGEEAIARMQTRPLLPCFSESFPLLRSFPPVVGHVAFFC